MILGIDEVGRGPWAGPLVVGAVVLPDEPLESLGLDTLTDSKKLSDKRRSQLDVVIRQNALGWGLGWVNADEIDEIGLSAALRLATIRAVEAVKVPYHEIIIDGTINFLSETTKGEFVTALPKADFLIPAVSAASIIAKVARDTYMKEMGIKYPNYGFESHVGYGTAKHAKALQDFGVTDIHRKSFAPIAKIIGATTASTSQKVIASTRAIGSSAEARAAEWLVSEGFEVLNRNWTTKYCEIDIVAKKGGRLYFIEVKFRSSLNQGTGLDAITAKKLQQMRFAAELYLTKFKHTGSSVLGAIDASESELKLITID